MAELESTMQWKVDITSFTKAMQEAKKALQSTNSEFKLATSTMDKWSNNTAGIEAKLKQLGGTLEAEKRILDIYNKAWEEAKKEFGETSPEAERLAKQVENQQIKINKTQVSIDKYNSKLNEMQKEQNESESALSKTTKAISDQETKLSSLKDEYKNAVLQYGKNSKEAKELATQIDNLSKELAENKKQMADADKAADELDHSLEDVGDSANQAASGGFTVLKGALANLVTQGINATVNGLKTLARETFNAGANFESGMSKVAAISGASGEVLDQLKQKAEEMGAKTKFSATEAASAFEYMAMAGWKTEDMLNGIEGIMNLAAASGEDLATTSDIVTDALTAMGYEAGEAGRLADVMAAASSNANTNVSMMGATFKYVAPIAGTLGFSMEDTAVAIGLMANAGIKGEMAGTALRSIFTRLSVDTDGCASALKEMGYQITNTDGSMKDLSEIMGVLRKAFDGLSESEQTALAKNIAGQEAMSGLLAIVNAAPKDFAKLTKAVQESNGAAEEMANTMNDNVGGQITLLKSKIEGIMIKVFEKASGSIKKSINTISKSLDQVDWNKFAKNAGDVAEKVADFFAFVVKNGSEIVSILKTIAVAFVTYKTVATVTSVITAFKKLFDAVKAGQTIMQALNLTMAANPYALVAAGIAALGIALGEYAKHQKEAIEAEYGLTAAQREAVEAANDLKASYDEVTKSRTESQNQINSEYGYIQGLISEYNSLIDANGKVKDGYQGRAEFILGELAKAFGMEKQQIRELIDENGKLGKSIDDLMIKKKAEASLSAEESNYKKAIADRAEAWKTYTNAQKTAKEAEDAYTKSIKENGNAFEEYHELLMTAPDIADDYYWANRKLILGQEELKKSLDNANTGVKDAEQGWININSTIKNYEGLMEASISGDVDKINESMLRMQNGFITAESNNRIALQNQVNDFRQMYRDMDAAVAEGSPYVTEEMANAAYDMYIAAKNELDKLPSSAETATKNAGDSAASGLNSKDAEVSGAASNITSNAVNTIASYADRFNSSGASLGDQYTSGIDSKQEQSKTSGESLGNKAKEGAETADSYDSGSKFGEGFFNGIGSWISKVWEKAKELAKSAWNGLKKGQEEGSPSKLTTKSGVFFGQGYALGIESMVKPVTDAASDLAKSAVNALGHNMNDQIRLIGKDGGNSLIDGLTSVIPNVSGAIGNLKTSVAGANAGMNNQINSVGTASSGGKEITTLNFYQTNNSPKSLNRWDIYRQTQNILQLVKG